MVNPQEKENTPSASPEIAELNEAEKIFLDSLLRLRESPAPSLRFQKGRMPLSELSREIQLHFFITSPDIATEPPTKRILIRPMTNEEMLANPHIHTRIKLLGNTEADLYMELGINVKKIMDLGNEQLDALFIPTVAILARFLQAAKSKSVKTKDVTYADRLQTVYAEAYELQRQYAEGINRQRITAGEKPIFQHIPTPAEQAQQLTEKTFGSNYPPHIPFIDMGIQDFLMILSGPTDEKIRRNPKSILQEVNIQNLAGNPFEQQRFRAALALHLAKVPPPDTLDFVLLQRALKQESIWLQDKKLRPGFTTMWGEYPLLKFVYERAVLYNQILKVVGSLYEEQTQELHMPQRQLNPANFDSDTSAYFGVLTMGEFLLEEVFAKRPNEDTG